MNCYSLKDISITKCIKRIGSNVFKDCKALSSIELPNVLLEIGKEAFEGCSNLETIVIPNNVLSIGECAFAWCGLTKIRIPQSVRNLSPGVFLGTHLKEIAIPKGREDFRKFKSLYENVPFGSELIIEY